MIIDSTLTIHNRYRRYGELCDELLTGQPYTAYDYPMFSYRHAFHAGNHADVLKHATLIAILNHMLEKDAALMVLDTHAGAGLYRLDGDYAQTSGESTEGIKKLIDSKIRCHPALIKRQQLLKQ